MPARMELPAKARVLLLGSGSTFERDMVATLRAKRCEVMVAADGREALDRTCTGQVDVLVVDFDTHGRELSQLTSKLGSAERRCRILILAGSLEQLTLASDAAADGVLMKPIDPNRVRIVIYSLLAGAHTRSQTEGWRLDTTPFPEAAPSRGDWGINE